MKKKLLLMFAISLIIITIVSFILLSSIFIIMDFFGANVTDGYVSNNYEYASEYKKVANNFIKEGKGYVSLERILYFYLADSSLSFEEIYYDNLDFAKKKILPIDEVCTKDKYKVLNVCNDDYLDSSNQINDEQAKPFVPPINFLVTNVTSFFMEERYVYNNYDVHPAWDFSAPDLTPLYSVCDGVVEKVSFPYLENKIDQNDKQGGNIIRISCEVNNLNYKVTYAHLYPNSSLVTEGIKVFKGQKIASVGTTGYSTGNHLHYQVSLDGKNIDGMSLIDFNY